MAFNWRVAVLGVSLISLAGCDAIRFPGDGRGEPEAAPEQPEPVVYPEGPEGAPGPPPPAAPVEDPYGTGVTEPDAASDPDSAEGSASTPDDAGEAEPAPDQGTSEEAGAAPADQTIPDPTPISTDPDAPLKTEPETPAPVEPDPVPVEPAFSYYSPGALMPGSGQGAKDDTVYAPGIVFPIKSAPTYLQSMVWRFGGGIGGGDECDPRNYEYPWQDNFCETRSSNRNSPYCPAARIHQGQDIRVGTPEGCNQMRRTSAADRELYEVVAVEDGVISNIGTYTVNVRAEGRIYRYMHLNMAKLGVEKDQAVKAGDFLGYVSKDFGGTPTTFHLHFEIIQNTAEHGWVHVPPYLSLKEAYERREGGPGERREPNVAVASAIPEIPEGFEIIE
ncbi:MAG: peptidoglycan DD-metalloendopeptidase family protein [Pseudomonadota bacterium]